MTVAEILAIVERLLDEETPRADVAKFLDDLQAERPELSGAVAVAKGLIVTAYDEGNVSDTFRKAVDETLTLFSERFGPVSDAPEVGLV